MTKSINIKIWFLNLISILFVMTHGRPVNHEFRVKAVNLGGWLVTEGWMKPSLFDAIPNKDFLVSNYYLNNTEQLLYFFVRK
jgi:hypothetical protein